MTTKLTTTLLGFAAGLAMIALPQTAQAQNSIAITGGTTIGGTNITNLTSIQITTAQGTAIFTSPVFRGGTGTGCPSACFGGQSLVGFTVSGTGFSPSGPVVFSNLPIIIGIASSLTPITITGGSFNNTDSFTGTPPALNTPDFSVGQFRFDPFPAPAAPAPAAQAPVTPTLTASTQNFNIPDPISLQTGKGQAEAIFQAAQQQSLRPNGMHTRIIPAWTPGLYQ
ncbi:hypothetical protein [Spirulina sp. CCNP1310]|uniref:hypothetical protein n=1 Tax=Spirulina sp. CCNP1310 TaxID=3110249 RepID=UPI002B20D731|nr:hypothetical protein [Spirulina sp. CCNP1310]